MPFLKGNAEILGGYIYGTSHNNLIIGQNKLCVVNNTTRVHELYSSHLDIKGNVIIKDSENCNKLEITSDKISLFGEVESNQLNVTNLDVCGKTNLIGNIIIKLPHECDHFTIQSDNTSLFNIQGTCTEFYNNKIKMSSSNATEINGNLDINLNLDNKVCIHTTVDNTTTSILKINNNNLSLDVLGNVKIDGILEVNQIKCLNDEKIKIDAIHVLETLSETENKNYAGLFATINYPNNDDCSYFIGSGFLWDKYNNNWSLYKNIEISKDNEEIINFDKDNDLGDLILNCMNSNNIKTKNIETCTETIDTLSVNKNILNSVKKWDIAIESSTSKITPKIINTTYFSTSVFSGTHCAEVYYKLNCPSEIDSYNMIHTIVCSHDLNGIIHICGNIYPPNASSNNSYKITLRTAGQSIRLMFFESYWYILNSGGEVSIL